MGSKSKPIAIIITDTHLDDGNEETNSRVYREARQLARDFGLTAIYHGGDIFEARKAQTQHLLTCFDRELSHFDDAGIDLFAVPGNHDKTDYAIAGSFLDPFRYHARFKLIRVPTEIAMPIYHEKDGRVMLSLAPFFNDEQYIISLKYLQLSDSKAPTKRVMLTHIGLDQAMMNNGMKVSSLVKAELFKDYDKVLIGHYHDASDYNANIRYIGSSIQHNFGERADKGITILMSDLSVQTVDPGTPKFFTYIVPVENLTNKRLAEIKKEKEEGQDQIRVVITGEEGKVKAFDKNRLQSAGIKVATKEEKILKEEVDERIEPFTDVTLKANFQKFCTNNNLDQVKGNQYFDTIFNTN